MFKLIDHYNFELTHIPGKENIPADVLSRLDHTTREMPDIPSHIPAQEIRAVQTRQSTKITKDLEEMAIRGEEDEEYRRLIKAIEDGENFENFEEGHEFAKYKSEWKNLKVIKTRGGD